MYDRTKLGYAMSGAFACVFSIFGVAAVIRARNPFIMHGSKVIRKIVFSLGIPFLLDFKAKGANKSAVRCDF